VQEWCLLLVAGPMSSLLCSLISWLILLALIPKCEQEWQDNMLNGEIVRCIVTKLKSLYPSYDLEIWETTLSPPGHMLHILSYLIIRVLGVLYEWAVSLSTDNHGLCGFRFNRCVAWPFLFCFEGSEGQWCSGVLALDLAWMCIFRLQHCPLGRGCGGEPPWANGLRAGVYLEWVWLKQHAVSLMPISWLSSQCCHFQMTLCGDCCHNHTLPPPH
jgi:hypothetical protein